MLSQIFLDTLAIMGKKTINVPTMMRKVCKRFRLNKKYEITKAAVPKAIPIA